MDGSRPFLLLLAAILFLVRLDVPLLEPEEARYAEIPRQMLAQGRFLVPVLHGDNYLHKPPLLYWLVMAFYQVLGVHDWVAHLVPALAGLATVLAGYFWLKHALGTTAAWWGTAILILSPRFVYQARILGMDSLLSLWVVLGWCWLQRGLEGGRRWWLLAGLAAGLGMLTKGPVALLLIAGPGMVVSILERRVRIGSWPLFFLAALAVAGPWFLALGMADGRAFADFFLVHNWQRFFEPLDHAEPWWFYLPYLVLGMLPWSLLVPVLCWRYSEPNRCKNPGGVFLLLAGTICVGFFSVSGCKRPGYILPAFVPLAGLLGAGFGSWIGRASAQRQAAARWLVPGAGFVLLLAAFVVWLPGYHHRFSLREQVAPGRELLEQNDLSVASYPKRWDSVGFYLASREVTLVDVERWNLREAALVFVKEGPFWERFQEALPADWTWEPIGAPGPRLRAGIVRPR